jgi:hypothetical protein
VSGATLGAVFKTSSVLLIFEAQLDHVCIEYRAAVVDVNLLRVSVKEGDVADEEQLCAAAARYFRVLAAAARKEKGYGQQMSLCSEEDVVVVVGCCVEEDEVVWGDRCFFSGGGIQLIPRLE